jgi:hypothetical protein
MMALISQFNAKHRDKYTTHKPIEADYYVLKTDGKVQLIQIDTRGTQDREIPDKLSQTIQLDRESARALFNILKEEFNFT